jgi:glyceraldehyde 3-phosphate dehydrogenase
MRKPKIKLFLNGFGRIGRSILRILAADPNGFELVAINDIEPLDTCAYLFEFDSVFGRWQGSVETNTDHLIIDGHKIPFHHVPDISALDLSEIDVVLECTGMTGGRSIEERGLKAGAQAVLVSGPSTASDVTLVMGANEENLSDHKIVSNASCTTNALAPLVKIIDEEYGLVSGHMTTVHCYTSSQPTVDTPRGDLARSRAAALSMVPTTTSAHKLIGEILPNLAGKLEARAIRVPTASVSAIDLTVQTDKSTTVETVNTMLKIKTSHSPILGWTTKPLVSTDLRARPESLILSGAETSVSKGGLLRVFGWYDNEWGFSNRMLDMAQLMGQRRQT